MDQTPSFLVVYDSGVGGRTIVSSIVERCPNANILYVCDDRNFPYGPKPESDVIKFVVENLKKVASQFHISGIVVACNTASTVALPSLRNAHAVPIIGVVPAIKPAAILSKSKIIGLLATPGTVARKYTTDLIQEFAPNCKVIKVGSSKLVELAEKKYRGELVSLPVIAKEVSPLIAENGLDTVVLGCTHFPLLLEELRQCLPNVSHWLDSGEAIAKRALEVIPSLTLGSGLREEFFTQTVCE